VSTATYKPWNIDLTIYHTEQDLVRGLHLHELMSCNCLVKQFEPRLMRTALKLAGESAEAEDIVQESFISACASITKFQAKSSLATWLHRIVLNTALMHQRRKKLSLLSIEMLNGEQHPLPGLLQEEVEGNPEGIVLLKERRVQLQQAIYALPEGIRDAFLLRAVLGISTKEAASRLGISETALKVRFHRARLMLQNSLTTSSEAHANLASR